MSGRLSRRRVLAATGATGLAAIAGCSGLNPFGGRRAPPTIDTSWFGSLGGDRPSIPKPDPVAVSAAYLDRTSAGVRETLSGVPHPLTAADVPNGAIREAVTSRYGDATDALDRAAAAASDAAALDALREARRKAHWSRAAWRAIDAGLTRRDVRDGVPDVANHVRSFRRRWRYVGDPTDPVRALLVHAAIEDRIADSRSNLRGARSPDPRSRETPPAVGDLASTVETARASVADAGQLFDRFVGSLAATRSYASTFESAESSLRATASSRRGHVPDVQHGRALVDADVGGLPVGEALDRLYNAVRFADAGHYREAGRVADAIRLHHSTLVHLRALRALRSAVRDGEYARVTSADDVRSIRSQALSAVEAAADSTTHPRLSRLVLHGSVAAIARSDASLARHRGTVSVLAVAEDVGRYVAVARVAPATPPASEAVATALDAASG